MRHKALPYLLPALQTLPPLLSGLFEEFGFRRQRLKAERRFRRRVLPAVSYTQAMIAPRLQAQLSPWLRELLETPALTRQVVEHLVEETSAAVQEAMYWAYSFEVGSRLVAAVDGGPRGRETRDMRALFVPLVCEQANWSPTLPAPLMQALRELLFSHGLVQPDEAVLVAPASLPPSAVVQVDSLREVVDFALNAAENAWGPTAAPAPELTDIWERRWRQPNAPAGAATLRPLEVRLALMVVVSPDLSPDVLDTLSPWQEEVRTELMLCDRFDSGAMLDFESVADAGKESQAAFMAWIDMLNLRLQDDGVAIVVAAPPSDAYSACGRGAVEVACQFVRAHEGSEDDDAPVFLLGDSSGLAVELGGASYRIPWVPDGPLTPAMLPVIDEVVAATMDRRVERSVSQDLDRLSLLGTKRG